MTEQFTTEHMDRRFDELSTQIDGVRTFVRNEVDRVEVKVDAVAADVHELREDVDDLSDRTTDVEQWKAARDGVIQTEIQAYHESDEYKAVLAEHVMPVMKDAFKEALRETFSWRRIGGTMATLALLLTVFNQAAASTSIIRGWL